MDNMIENMARFYSGYIQIQENDFKENPSINNTFNYSSDLDSILTNHTEITQFTHRVESFALAAADEKSYGTAVFGINPELEDNISEISKWVESGSYLQTGDKGVLIGKQLAENLELQLNDTVVLLGQGYHGVTAAGKYEITGIMNFPLSGMNNNLLYMDLENCRELFSIPNSLTSIVIMLDDREQVPEVTNALNQNIQEHLTAYTWKEILVEIENLIAGKLASGKIIMGILFMVIGFGIWGTIIMLMAERKREFGIMIALGVRKSVLTWVLMFESILIGLLGILAGFLGSFPILYYFNMNPIRVTGDVAETYSQMGFEPIIKFSIDPQIFLNPTIIVFVLFAIIFIYPVINIRKLKTADALRA